MLSFTMSVGLGERLSRSDGAEGTAGVPDATHRRPRSPDVVLLLGKGREQLDPTANFASTKSNVVVELAYVTKPIIHLWILDHTFCIGEYTLISQGILWYTVESRLSL